jgi:putative endonuclease
MAKRPCVYILASRLNGTLYVGVTADLLARLHQHRTGTDGVTGRYKVARLVRCEFFADMLAAIAREKQLKRWRREWKMNLIERDNPDWADLAVSLRLAPLGPSTRLGGP